MCPIRNEILTYKISYRTNLLQFSRTNIDRERKERIKRQCVFVSRGLSKDRGSQKTKRLTVEDREILGFRRWCFNREGQLPVYSKVTVQPMTSLRSSRNDVTPDRSSDDQT